MNKIKYCHKHVLLKNIRKMNFINSKRQCNLLLPFSTIENKVQETQHSSHFTMQTGSSFTLENVI